MIQIIFIYSCIDDSADYLSRANFINENIENLNSAYIELIQDDKKIIWLDKIASILNNTTDIEHINLLKKLSSILIKEDFGPELMKKGDG